MNQRRHQAGREGERGSILLVIVFVATAIAALAAISSGRVVAETRLQTVLESESRAYSDAMGQIQLAMNVVNNSAYNDQNHNLELRASINGDFGGTAGGDQPSDEEWLRDPDGVLHGLVRGTEVRAYRAADYLRRLAKLKDQPAPTDPDLDALSQSYFVVEAQGRSGAQVRLVSALVRENQPFSSFVFFQNNHTLGVSGKPRGLIHSNDAIDFYFANGEYVDGISAVNGFGYTAGATTDNTKIVDGNPSANPITLEAIDFDVLRDQSSLFVGAAGLDAEIQFYGSGDVRIRQYSPPHYEMVTVTRTESYISGYEDVVSIESQRFEIGTEMETRVRTVTIGYETEYYDVTIPIYEWQDVERTRDVPIYERQTLTGTRWVQVFVPYDTEAGGGTAVGGGGDTVPGEYVWVQEEYTYQADVIVGYTQETYIDSVRVQIGTDTETRSRQVAITAQETYEVEVPIYEWRDVEVTNTVPIWAENVWEEQEEVFVPRSMIQEDIVDLKVGEGAIFIDGRITSMQGELNGRVTIVGNEKVRITGDIQYVDDDGDTAMLNGKDYNEPYERNPDYEGKSTLGVIARDDLLFTRHMSDESEVNGTLMSVQGRVGIDGFAITAEGEPTKDYYYDLTAEERKVEEAYDRDWWTSTRRYAKDSLRRMGGIISNDRILETYIRSRSDGTSYVDSGFKRGSMKFDISLIFNPPPNFVEVPRPVLSYYAPVFFVRGEED